MLGVELLELEINLMLGNLKPFEEDNDTYCECGEHKAKWTLTDDLMKGWHMNLCDKCLKEVKAEYEGEGTEYVVGLLKK